MHTRKSHLPILLLTTVLLAPAGAAAQSVTDLSRGIPDSSLSREPYTEIRIEGEELRRLDILSPAEILTLQSQAYEMRWFDNVVPGYRDRGFQQIHVRGGRHAETAFLIDGSQATNLLFDVPLPLGDAGVYEAMVILPGGLGARHGRTLSGVVDLITREQAGDAHATLEGRTSELSGTTRDPLRDATVVRAWGGGQVPLTGAVRYFVSGQADTRRDFLARRDAITFDVDPDPSTPGAREPDIDYDPEDPYVQWGPDGRRIHPMDTHAGWLPMGFDAGWDGLFKLSRPLGQGRIDLAWIRRGFRRAPYTFAWRYSMMWGHPEGLQHHLTMGTLRYDASDALDIIDGSGSVTYENEKNVVIEDDGLVTLRWDHRAGPGFRYTARYTYSGQHRRMRVYRWVNEDGYTSDRSRYDPVTGTGRWTPDDPMHRVVLQPTPGGNWGYDPDRRGYVPIYGAGLGNHGSDRYYEDSAYLRRGLDLRLEAAPHPHHALQAGASCARLTLDEFELQLLYLDPPYLVDFREPMGEYAFYLQDRVEYDHLTLDIGLRYEAYRRDRTPYWVDPRDPVDPSTGDVIPDPFWDELDGDLRRSPRTRSMLSPRVAAAHPIGQDFVVFANWGLYQKPPVYRNMYLEGSFYEGTPLVGNPDLLPERNTQTEFGMRGKALKTVQVQVTLWIKDASQLVGTEEIPAFYQGTYNPYGYTVFLNYDHLLARGLDLSLTRRLTDRWGGRLTYTAMRSETNRDDPWEGYRESRTLHDMPKRVRPAGWDTPHRIGAEVTWLFPEGSGLLVQGLHPLQRMALTLIYRGIAGTPYTPTTRTSTGERNSARLPWSHRFDLLASRDLTLLGLECSLLVTVRNLFDRRNVLTVFSRTGSPEDPGAGATSYSDSYDRWHHYATPRFIDLGLRISF